MINTITISAIAGKNEVVLKKSPTVFELNDSYMKVTCKYLVDKPKDDNEDSYMREEFLNEYMATIKKSSIVYIAVIFNNKLQQYIVDITLNEGGWGYGMEDRPKAIELYDQLVEWWEK